MIRPEVSGNFAVDTGRFSLARRGILRQTAKVAKKPSSNKVSVGGAWKPRLFFWMLVAAVVALSGREVINVMEHPSLTRFSGPAGAGQFVLYQKGKSRDRLAWLYVEPEEDRAPPVCFHRIDCSEKDTVTGDLRWSFDGMTLYASRRQAGSLEAADRPLWAYEFTTGKLWTLQPSEMAAGLHALAATEAELVDIINRHGGKGPVAVSWYDLGKRGAYLFAWEITRWERALPE